MLFIYFLATQGEFSIIVKLYMTHEWKVYSFLIQINNNFCLFIYSHLCCNLIEMATSKMDGQEEDAHLDEAPSMESLLNASPC